MRKKTKKKLTKENKEHIVNNAIAVTDLVDEMRNLMLKKTKGMDGVRRLFIVKRAVLSLYAQTFQLSLKVGEEQLAKEPT